MPAQVDACVESVLEDNPSYSEGRAYAICWAQENEGNLSEDTTPEDVGRIAQSHNLAPECAASYLADGELAEDDPCWEGYTQVGMKTDTNGNEVPNCVPDEDVPDAEGYENSLSESRILAVRDLAGPIKREELSDGSVVYENIKILTEGEWTDSNSRETIKYDPANLSVVDGAPVNVMHDSNNDVSAVGALDAESAYVEDGALYADVRLHKDNAASEYADENLKQTLETNGQQGFGGPSVEIPAEGQEIDGSQNPPELADGKIDGLAFVAQPAARDTAFAQQTQERAVALSGDNDKGVWTKKGHMDRNLADPGELREILDMFGADVEELDDEEVMDMAEDLHDDLMEELEGSEMAEHGEEMDPEEEPEGPDEMAEMMQELEDMKQEMMEMQEREDKMESEMQELREKVDMGYDAEKGEDLEEDLEAARAELSEAKERIAELEDEPTDPKSLSEDGEIDYTESTLEYDSSRGTF